MFIKNKKFLYNLLIYTISAFGGHHNHIGLMHKYFVLKNKFISESELFEYYSIAQILPGPTSTQTLLMLSMKIDGKWLTFLTLFIWILPASVFMIFISFILPIVPIEIVDEYFKFIPLLIVALIVSSALSLLAKVQINWHNILFFIITIGVILRFFNSPFTLPIVLFGSGLYTFLLHPVEATNTKVEKKKVKWQNLLWIVVLYLFMGLVSEKASQNNWKYKNIINISEMNFRFGTIIYGGGDVLFPLMYNQLIARPKEHYNQKIDDSLKIREINSIESKEFFLGTCLVKIIPGPIYAFSGFAGGLITKKHSIYYRCWAAILSIFFIFFPGLLIVLFIYPLWINIKHYKFFKGSILGINLSIISILLASAIYFFKEFVLFETKLPLARSDHKIYSILFSLAIVLILALLAKIKKIPIFVLLLLTICLSVFLFYFKF